MKVSQKIDFEFRIPKKLALHGRVPTVTRMLALAHYYDRLLRQKKVDSISHIACLEQVSQQRISQIIGLLLLCPEIQELILTLPLQVHGNKNLSTEKLIQVAQEISFDKQIDRFQEILSVYQL